MVPDKVIAFNTELSFFFTKIRCPCPLIRTNKEDLSDCGDFSFNMCIRQWEKYLPDGNLKTLDSKMQRKGSYTGSRIRHIVQYWFMNRNAEETAHCEHIQEVLPYLRKCSKSWPFVVSRCYVTRDIIGLHLDRKHTFQTIIELILTERSKYGHSVTKEKSIAVTSNALHEEAHEMDLSEMRLKLLRDCSVKLLEAVGYEVALECSNCCPCLHLTTKSSDKGNPDCQQVLCGVVINSKHRCKDTNTKSQDYLRLRCADMRMMAEHKYADVSSKEDDFLNKLGDAAMKMDLLNVKPSHTVSVCIDDAERCRETSCRGAAFALYNCARLSTIIREHERRVRTGYYPPLVTVEEVDFSLLSKEEEWTLLFVHLLVYPHVLNKATMNVEQGKLSPNLICKFIMDLCSCFSIYYRRVHILTERRCHLLPVMGARLYLLQAIQEVLCNALGILGISPVFKM